VEVVASLSQGRTAAAQCGLFTHKSVPVIFEPPCSISLGNLVFVTREGHRCTGAAENDLTRIHGHKRKEVIRE